MYRLKNRKEVDDLSLKSKDGYTTILVVMISSILIPMFIFVIMEMTQALYVKEKMSGSIQQTIRTASWQVNENALEDGRIELNHVETEEFIRERMNEVVNGLDGALSEKPSIDIQILDDMNSNQESPSIRVKSEFSVSGLISDVFFPITIDEEYELYFNENKKHQKLETVPADGINWANVVNPYEKYEDLIYPFSTTTNGVKLIGGTNNHIQVDLPFISGSYQITFSDRDVEAISGVIGESGGFEFYIPKKIEKGTQVYMQLDLLNEEISTEKVDTENPTASPTTPQLAKISTAYDNPLLIGEIQMDIGEILINQSIETKGRY